MFNTWMDGFKIKLGFPGDSDGKESTFSAGDPGLILGWAGSLEKGMQPTLALLPRESHGQRSLASYSPWATKSWTSLSYTELHHITHITELCASGKRVLFFHFKEIIH